MLAAVPASQEGLAGRRRLGCRQLGRETGARSFGAAWKRQPIPAGGRESREPVLGARLPTPTASQDHHHYEHCDQYFVLELTRTSCCGKGPREFSGTLMGGMTQSRFCRRSPLALWCCRHGSRVSLCCCTSSPGSAFLPLGCFGNKKAQPVSFFLLASQDLSNSHMEQRHNVFMAALLLLPSHGNTGSEDQLGWKRPCRSSSQSYELTPPHQLKYSQIYGAATPKPRCLPECIVFITTAARRCSRELE